MHVRVLKRATAQILSANVVQVSPVLGLQREVAVILPIISANVQLVKLPVHHQKNALVVPVSVRIGYFNKY